MVTSLKDLVTTSGYEARRAEYQAAVKRDDNSFFAGKLVKLGYLREADKNNAAKYEAAVRKIQTKFDLTVDGDVGKNTAFAIEIAENAKITAKTKTSPELMVLAKVHEGTGVRKEGSLEKHFEREDSPARKTEHAIAPRKGGDRYVLVVQETGRETSMRGKEVVRAELSIFDTHASKTLAKIRVKNGGYGNGKLSAFDHDSFGRKGDGINAIYGVEPITDRQGNILDVNPTKVRTDGRSYTFDNFHGMTSIRLTGVPGRSDIVIHADGPNKDSKKFDDGTCGCVGLTTADRGKHIKQFAEAWNNIPKHERPRAFVVVDDAVRADRAIAAAESLSPTQVRNGGGAHHNKHLVAKN